MTAEYGKAEAGRHIFDGKDETEVLTKCEYVWAMGGTDAEASFWAGISTASLSRYLSAHPEVCERRDSLRNQPILLARTNIQNAIKAGETDTSKWYLERKAKGEFIPKQAVEHSGSMDVNVTNEERNKLRAVGDALAAGEAVADIPPVPGSETPTK